MIKITECPRDAMQGIKEFIPTKKKADYINSLLKVGFDTIDFGSFVSPKAIPQLVDTAKVLNKLELEDTSTKLLSIIANQRGAEDACNFDEITYLGFPFSVSETFQQRNTNSSIEESLIRVSDIQNICIRHNKTLVVYLSMAFGNPYGDKWNSEIVTDWADKLINKLGIKIISLADTIGVSNPQNISYLFSSLIPEFPEVEISAHLHTTPTTWKEKIETAYANGCKSFDVAIKGYGGCPMAADELTGNMPTENLLAFCNDNQLQINLSESAFEKSMQLSDSIFSAYH